MFVNACLYSLTFQTGSSHAQCDRNFGFHRADRFWSASTGPRRRLPEKLTPRTVLPHGQRAGAGALPLMA